MQTDPLRKELFEQFARQAGHCVDSLAKAAKLTVANTAL